MATKAMLGFVVVAMCAFSGCTDVRLEINVPVGFGGLKVVGDGAFGSIEMVEEAPLTYVGEQQLPEGTHQTCVTVGYQKLDEVTDFVKMGTASTASRSFTVGSGGCVDFAVRLEEPQVRRTLYVTLRISGSEGEQYVAVLPSGEEVAFEYVSWLGHILDYGTLMGLLVESEPVTLALFRNGEQVTPAQVQMAVVPNNGLWMWACNAYGRFGFAYNGTELACP